jgi:serine/threonine protein kinase
MAKGIMDGSADTTILTDPVGELDCSHCGARLNVAAFSFMAKIACPKCTAELTVPGRFGAFLLTGLLGRGGMGAAYRGQDVSLNRLVAIKVMLSSYGDDPEFVANFRREAQAAAALNHPNVVQIYSFGIEKGQPYIVMELLTGGRFDAMIARGELIDQSLVVKIGTDVAEGLNAANNIGLIHGDVKPENILLDANGNAKVVDFGLAYFRDKGQQPDGIWGTPYYIAPEKVRRQPSDARSDIYSLGATLFHALAGQPPFEGKTPIDVVKARLVRPAPDLHEVRPDIKPELETIIRRMLEAEPARRHPNYQSLISDLRALQNKMGMPTSPTLARKKVIMSKGGKKIVTSRTSTGNVPVPSERIASTRLSDNLAAAATLGSIGQMDEGDPKIRKQKKWRIIFWILMGVLFIGGTITGLTYNHSINVRISDEIAIKKMEAAQRARHLQAHGAFIEIRTLSSNTLSIIERSEKALQTASNQTDAILAVARSLPDLPSAKEALNSAPLQVGNIANHGAAIKKAAGNLKTLESDAFAKRAAVIKADSAVEADAILEAFKSSIESAHAMDKLLRESAAKIDVAITNLTLLKETLDKARIEKESEDKKRAAQQAEIDRKAAIEAEARKQEEAQKELARREAGKVDEAVKKNLSLIRMNQFTEALDALPLNSGELTTPAGQVALATARKRVELMQSMKEFLIVAIGEEVKSKGAYRYGWLTPNLDVLGASGAGIDIRGLSVTPWNRVSIRQMIAFINYFLNPDSEAIKTRKERARINLAAAAYFFECAGGEKVGLKMATDRAAEALKNDETLRDQARTLLPDLNF